MIDLRTLQRALGGEISGGQLLCPGPGHSAVDRSLSVKPDDNAPDGFLVHSFAHDDPIACKDYVREKLGSPAFKPNGSNGRRRASDEAIERALMAAVQSRSDDKPKGRVVATFDYTDENGQLLYQVLKYEPKSFRQRRPDGNGGFIWSLGDVPRVLYRWPELLKFPDATVFICEGEKDANRVASLGHCATAVAHGKWTDDCVKALAGRDIIILEDNDKKGRMRALEAAQALDGTAKSIRVVLLPDLPNKGDVSDWLDADPRRTEKLVRICFDTPEWTPEDTDADTNTNAAGTTSADTAKEESKPASEPPLLFINIGAWQNQPVPERVWTVKDRIPGNNVTLLSGEGSIGKSILSLHLSTAVVLGRDWLQSLPDPGPAIIACCEDDTSEIWRRLDLIFQHYGAAYTDFKDLHVLALAGEETLMARPDRKGIIQPTKLFTGIRDAALDIKPRLVVLDNSADIFGGNENDRAQVRQFIGILRGMAIAAGCGVLLTSHPSLTGISSGSGLSGSTAWNASVRSRLYFKRAMTDKDEEPDPDLRVLEVMKTNYGRPGETITLKWNNGLFLPVGGVSNLEKLAAEQKADQLFLALLDRFNGQGRNTSERSSANNYAPTLFAKESEAKELGIKKAGFEDAMRRLFAADKIRLEPYGAPSKGTARLVCCGLV
jgi:RecA-family ATPase